MNHEPECPRSWTSSLTGEPLMDEVPEGFECVYCLVALNAYKRGREEAGIAITDRLLSANARGEMPSEDVVTLVKAARGERE